MKASQLVAQVERAGGKFVMDGRTPYLENPECLPAHLLDELLKERYLVRAHLRERAFALCYARALAEPVVQRLMEKFGARIADAKLAGGTPEDNNTYEQGDKDMEWTQEPFTYEKPSEKTHLAAIWDVKDAGYVEEDTPDGRVKKHKAIIKFVTDELGADGKTLLTITKRLNVSFGETAKKTSTLVNICRSALGRNPVPEPGVKWDPDELIGRLLMIQVERKNWKGGIFADVTNTTPAPDGATLAIPERLVQARAKRLAKLREAEQIAAREATFGASGAPTGGKPAGNAPVTIDRGTSVQTPANGHTAPTLSQEFGVPASGPSEPPPTDQDMPAWITDEEPPF
jgi:hypothetical protein